MFRAVFRLLAISHRELYFRKQDAPKIPRKSVLKENPSFHSKDANTKLRDIPYFRACQQLGQPTHPPPPACKFPGSLVKLLFSEARVVDVRGTKSGLLFSEASASPR